MFLQNIQISVNTMQNYEILQYGACIRNVPLFDTYNKVKY